MNRKHTMFSLLAMLAAVAVMACNTDSPLGELETAPEAVGPPVLAEVIDFKTAPMAEVERAAKEVEAGGLARVDEVVYARARLDSLQGPHGPALAVRWGIPLEEAIAIEAGFLDFVTDFLTPTLTTAQHLEQLGEIRAERLEEQERLIEAGDADGAERTRERLETLDKIISHYTTAGGDLGSLSYSGYDCPGTPRIESMKNSLRHYTRQNKDGEDRLYVAVHSMHYVYPAAQTTVSQTFLRSYGDARGSTVKHRGVAKFHCDISSGVNKAGLGYTYVVPIRLCFVGGSRNHAARGIGGEVTDKSSEEFPCEMFPNENTGGGGIMLPRLTQ